MSRLVQRRLLPSSPTRLFSTTRIRAAFAPSPAPPRLPPKEQEEFERLQRTSTGAFSTSRPSVTVNRFSALPPKGTPQINQSPASTAETLAGASSVSDTDIKTAAVNARRVQATGEVEELHPDVRRGAKPEFEGHVNPKTGEIGGPKNEPLRWGSTGERGDWSYNGRVTDF